ncbi:PaaI family thioesterase [Anaerovorax odorimutans]|uniref:Acyl-coenzyme A thioesterase THEM4 n=1 Tax=Anaerovorax odorimutans TaxID=109327 RepID=A0ABT1RJX8_9FIRM|nr:PaaI family thioesterase [Anaerovorax odorimutans]MCQ4635475.1 PaaI family thioesterase [Anaerovorax odorimutans]
MKQKIKRKQNNSARCIVCGDQNKASLGCRFYELENGEIAATFRSEDWHQSYPGRMHGGMAAGVLDELIGRAAAQGSDDFWGVTVELHMKYKKPIPTEADLKAVARVTKKNRKLFEGTGEILLPDGTVAVEAWGKYMILPLSKISDGGFAEEEWYQIEEDDPKEIDL